MDIMNNYYYTKNFRALGCEKGSYYFHYLLNKNTLIESDSTHILNSNLLFVVPELSYLHNLMYKDTLMENNPIDPNNSNLIGCFIGSLIGTVIGVEIDAHLYFNNFFKT